MTPLKWKPFPQPLKLGGRIDEALELEDAEYWRYALISLRPEQRDTNFTWEEFERKVNTELNDVLGNFVHRTTSFIQTHYKGKVPEYSTTKEQHAKILASLSTSLPSVDDRLGH